ncbi:fatty acyl-AMP ligase [Nocardia macrotermitis]|uniref:4-hydroxyphenylalkanoate adenylyltransferase n=1 Tax=Nocardia macrotermitis TaxID=2585198 RepID=A0A7K0DDW3_9NOCA|nr:fatty acyl-AMP ligase [Nocardia macrotermitis]MQY23990.1 4-hydroxyphenylalkanoate adenylyltransferase [Nocardia macrotermitis]
MNGSVDALAAAVAKWAAARPDAPAFTALSYPAGECRSHSLTFGGLHSAAGVLAAKISADTDPDDRVAILCDHGLNYVTAFLACLYAARVAVPLFPVQGNRNADRLAAVLDDARPTLSLVDPGSEIRTASGEFETGKILPVSIAPTDTAIPPQPATDCPAYLQYTSGSTKTPAGVEVSHDNLAAALDQLRTGMPVVNHKPVVTWLPFFHDMGLVFALSLPLYTGVHAVTLPPAEFAKRPIRWLRACGDYRAGATASPNFGLAHAISSTTPTERAELDLSELELVLNGAEPIRPEVLTTFTNTFSPYGFRHTAHTAGYGLAEATLPVAFGTPDQPPATAEFDRTALADGRVLRTEPGTGIRLVGCGTPAGQHIRLVDHSGTPVAANEVGEVWVRGPNVCAGYFRKPHETVETFGANSPGEHESWLRTGDLGFLHEGQLYIAGRRTDMIVIAGRNHYPADIESTAADSAPELRPGHVTAFGVDEGTHEALIVIAELDESPGDTTELARRIRAAVATAHDIAPAEVVLVARGQIPKTSSGKLRRGECRIRYRRDELLRVDVVPRV